jgi:hypothetical protein
MNLSADAWNEVFSASAPSFPMMILELRNMNADEVFQLALVLQFCYSSWISSKFGAVPAEYFPRMNSRSTYCRQSRA